jgi:hypothetical protein
MVAEEHEKPGLFGPQLRMDVAEEALHRISGRRKRKPGAGHDLPFTRNAQSLFEAAYEVCMEFKCSVLDVLFWTCGLDSGDVVKRIVEWLCEPCLVPTAAAISPAFDEQMKF